VIGAHGRLNRVGGAGARRGCGGSVRPTTRLRNRNGGRRALCSGALAAAEWNWEFGSGRDPPPPGLQRENTGHPLNHQPTEESNFTHDRTRFSSERASGHIIKVVTICVDNAELYHKFTKLVIARQIL
jgi:hypothetical protein